MLLCCCGDAVSGHTFFDTAKRVLDFALDENDAGRCFPVMGICLGFETLMILVAGKAGGWRCHLHQ